MFVKFTVKNATLNDHRMFAEMSRGYLAAVWTSVFMFSLSRHVPHTSSDEAYSLNSVLMLDFYVQNSAWFNAAYDKSYHKSFG
jgi:hypothetical protein